MVIDINLLDVSQLPAPAVPLVNKFYQANKARGKAKRDEQVWVVRDNNIKESSVVGACRIQSLDQYFLLTGLMVEKNKRHLGIGENLVSTMLTAQQQDLYTFPYVSLLPWYQQLGFEMVDGEDVPKQIMEKFHIYRQQGRDIVVMKWSAKLR